MTPGTAPLRLRPLSLPDLLDELFRLYRRHFAVIAGVSLAIAIPGLVLGLVSGSYRLDVGSLQDLVTNANDPDALAALQQRSLERLNPGLFGLSILVALVMVPVTVGAVIRAATAVAMGELVSVGSVLRGTLARYWGIAGLVLLQGVGLVGLVLVVGLLAVLSPLLLILLVPAGLVVTWVGVQWAVAIPALFTEGLGPVQALGRSWGLVRGRWWRTFGILIVAGILASVVSTAVTSLFGGLAFLVPLDRDLRNALVSAVSGVVATLANPIGAIAVTLLYLDLRVRKEGLDLEQLAKQTTPGTSLA